jgi:hypothetical protein
MHPVRYPGPALHSGAPPAEWGMDAHGVRVYSPMGGSRKVRPKKGAWAENGSDCGRHIDEDTREVSRLSPRSVVPLPSHRPRGNRVQMSSDVRHLRP